MGEFFSAVFVGLIMGALLGITIFIWAGMGMSDDWWKRTTVERGLAIYCPDNGEWAWIGECENE